MLYDIATKLAVAYKQYRILDDPNFESRILLIYVVKLTFKKIFNLLGIDPVEKIWYFNNNLNLCKIQKR